MAVLPVMEKSRTIPEDGEGERTQREREGVRGDIKKEREERRVDRERKQ